MLAVETVVLDERLRKFGGLPARATPGAGAIDLRSCEDGPVTIAPQEVRTFHFGFAIHIRDPGVAGIILPRSGLGRNGLVLANTVGLIDSDYQGPLQAAAFNRNPPGGLPITVNPGDRIFQLVFLPVVAAALAEVDTFSESTARGTGGYGSTGI